MASAARRRCSSKGSGVGSQAALLVQSDRGARAVASAARRRCSAKGSGVGSQAALLGQSDRGARAGFIFETGHKVLLAAAGRSEGPKAKPEPRSFPDLAPQSQFRSLVVVSSPFLINAIIRPRFTSSRRFPETLNTPSFPLSFALFEPTFSRPMHHSEARVDDTEKCP